MSRRRLLASGGALAGGALLAGANPVAATEQILDLQTGGGSAAGTVGASRPIITHGVQSGDVTGNTAVIWSRADRRARMQVEISAHPDFRDARILRGPSALPARDYTTKLRVGNLPRGQQLYYRVSYDNRGKMSEPVVGSLRTTPRRGDDIRFTWVGDCAGQGWGINPDFGGMKGWETMRTFNPDFMIFSGDTVYADGPLVPEVDLANGGTWKNLMIPEKEKVAETLDEFRGQFKYNLLDENVRRFLAQTPMISQWDDHEVTNNWYPGEILQDDRYVVNDVDLLARRAKRAFGEYMPIGATVERQGRVYRKINYGPNLDVFVLDMRTFKDPNDTNLQTDRGDAVFLGRRQIEWLIRSLARSTATWKVIAADMPIGLLVPDGSNWEAIANGDNGEPLGRELEIAYLLGQLKQRGVSDVVWLTADVHYAAAHHYHPDRAAFKGFDPFWEFVSGPIHAGTFGPNGLDDTFGPEVDFSEAALYPNMPPSDGRQYFGVVDIDAASKDMTVKLVNIDGHVLYTKTLANSGS
jgi:alkaline phosphatase D